MTSLKQQTISGMTWGFAGNFAGQAIGFIIGLILARLLSPKEYGLIGMVTVFIVLTEPFINSGFNEALIRKAKCSEKDYSSVFYFNLCAGIVFYLLIFFTAPFISSFFKEPEIIRITRAIGIIIIINAASLIQATILTKEVNFKLLTKINLASSLVSGIFGIVLAFRGLGVWALVIRTITDHFIRSCLLWIINNWRPHGIFSLQIIKELFGFSSRILVSAIIDKIYSNIYNLVIAKFFSAKELGLYTRGQMFKNFASESITEVIGRVSFPILSQIQNDPDRLQSTYKTTLITTQYIVSILMLVLASIAEPLILTLIGEKWMGSVIYLQLLCFIGLLYPMHAITRNLMYVFGRSKLVLRLQVFTKILAIPAIIVGIFVGIIPMILVMIATSLTEMIVKTHLAGKLVNYPLITQLKDMAPSFLLAVTTGGILFILNLILKSTPAITLTVQITTGAIMILSFSEFFKIREYILLKSIIKEKVTGYWAQLYRKTNRGNDTTQQPKQ